MNLVFVWFDFQSKVANSIWFDFQSKKIKLSCWIHLYDRTNTFSFLFCSYYFGIKKCLKFIILYKYDESCYNFNINNRIKSLRDGTGRHPGFRNQCTCACRFESDRRHEYFVCFFWFKNIGLIKFKTIINL